jgi:hypothetical protein
MLIPIRSPTLSCAVALADELAQRVGPGVDVRVWRGREREDPARPNAYYAQCMAARRYPPPPYSATAPAYAPAPGYAPQPSYPSLGSSGNATSNDLNRQELNRLNDPPSYPWPPRY